MTRILVIADESKVALAVGDGLRAERLTKGTTIQYELQIKGAAKKSVAFTPDEKLVPPGAPEKK